MTDTNRAEPMKPCPCGGAAKLWASAMTYMYRCDACGASGQQEYRDADALAAWNREASRLPLAGAATSPVHICVNKDAACEEIAPAQRCFACPLKCSPAPSDAARPPTAPAGAREAMAKAVLAMKSGNASLQLEAVELLDACLAAAPLERIALSDEQVEVVVFRHLEVDTDYNILKQSWSAVHNFARAIEAEHGITLAQKGDVNG